MKSSGGDRVTVIREIHSLASVLYTRDPTSEPDGWMPAFVELRFQWQRQIINKENKGELDCQKHSVGNKPAAVIEKKHHIKNVVKKF